MTRKFYDLSRFTDWLAANGSSAVSVRRCENALIDLLIAYRQPLGAVDPVFAGADSGRLREHMDQMTQERRTRAITAWNQWRRWIGTMGWSAPAYEPRDPQEDPLDPFIRWLAAAASPATVVGYRARVRGIIQYMGWTTIPPEAADEEAIQTYLEGLPASTATLARSAWGAFAAWARESRGVLLPDVRRARGRIVVQPRSTAGTPDRVGLPEEVESALWELFRNCPRFTPDIAASPSIIWRCVIREGFLITIRDARSYQYAGWSWHHESRYAWDVLTKWAAGDAPDPDPLQPVLPSERGGTKPIDLDALHRIILRGQRQRIPPLIPVMPDPKELAARPFPPPPPPPPGCTPFAPVLSGALRLAEPPQKPVEASPLADGPLPAKASQEPAGAPPATPDLPPPGESEGVLVARLEVFLADYDEPLRKAAARLYRTILAETGFDSEAMVCEFSGNRSVIELVRPKDRAAWDAIREFMADRGLEMTSLPADQ